MSELVYSRNWLLLSVLTTPAADFKTFSSFKKTISNINLTELLDRPS